MEVTEEMVDRIAHLARLSFDDAEKAEIRTDLERMIGFVDRLMELDLDGVEPLVHMVESGNRWRDDVPVPTPSTEEALREAPAAAPPFFSVPKVIQKD